MNGWNNYAQLDSCLTPYFTDAVNERIPSAYETDQSIAYFERESVDLEQALDLLRLFLGFELFLFFGLHVSIFGVVLGALHRQVCDAADDRGQRQKGDMRHAR